MTTYFPIASINSVCEFLRAAGESQPVLHTYFVIFAIAVPLIMALALAISGKLPESAVKAGGIIGFVVPGLISLWLAGVYMASGYDGLYAFTMAADLGLEEFGIRLHLGLNGMALPFYVLSGVVGMAAGLYAIQSKIERLRLFLVLLLVMQAGLMGVFSAIDVLFFYFFHEFALIPTFVMIAIWADPGGRRWLLK